MKNIIKMFFRWFKYVTNWFLLLFVAIVLIDAIFDIENCELISNSTTYQKLFKLALNLSYSYIAGYTIFMVTELGPREKHKWLTKEARHRDIESIILLGKYCLWSFTKRSEKLQITNANLFDKDFCGKILDSKKWDEDSPYNDFEGSTIMQVITNNVDQIKKNSDLFMIKYERYMNEKQIAAVSDLCSWKNYAVFIRQRDRSLSERQLKNKKDYLLDLFTLLKKLDESFPDRPYKKAK